MLKYEDNEYDLDSLFQYEVLKKLIEALAKNQQKFNERLNEIEDRGYNGNSHLDSNENKGETCDYNNKSKVKRRPQVNMNNNNDDDSINEMNDNKEEEGEEGNTVSNELQGRIELIEKRLNELSLIRKLLKATDKKIDSQNVNILSISEKVDVNSIEINDIKDSMQMGINQADNNNNLNNNKNASDSNNNNEDILSDLNQDNNNINQCIKKLELKTLTKFNIVKDRMKLIESEAMQSKQNQMSLKNDIEQIFNQITQFNELTSKLNADLTHLINNSNNNITQLDHKYTDQYNILNADITNLKQDQDLLKQQQQQQQQQPQYTSTNKTPLATISEVDSSNKDNADSLMQLYHKSNKRLSQLEKGVNAFKDKQTSDTQSIKDSIVKLEDIVNLKIDNSGISALTTNQNQMQNKLIELKDFTDSIDKTVYNQVMDIKSLFKKIELISGSMLNMEEDIKKTKRPIDFGVKYVELKIFNNEMAKTAKDFESIIKSIDELNKQIGRITFSCSNNATKTELTKLDKDLNKQIEELRIALMKKYATKSETTKSIKQLDLQLKQLIIDVSNRKEKTETCMLASKALGYKCASCEAEVANYEHNKFNYLPWKNYPFRDNEGSYRSGNGFSRLLQRVVLDDKKTEDNAQVQCQCQYESDDNNNNENENKMKRLGSEERIGTGSKNGMRNKIQLNTIGRNQNKLSIDIIDSKRINTSLIAEEKEREPKPIKIYKKPKNCAVTSSGNENKKVTKSKSCYDIHEYNISDQDINSFK